jgi:hypothetical protein
MFLEEETRKVIKAMPDVQFHIIGAEPKGLPKNCVVHGWVDGGAKEAIYRQCAAYLSLVKHGGVSWTGVELSRLGRWVVTTWKGYHGWGYAKGAKDAIPLLRKILKAKKLNIVAAKHYGIYTTDFFYDEFMRIVMGR